MVHKSGLTWVIVFGVIVLMFLQLPPMVAQQDSVVHTYSALVEVDALAKQQYVEPILDDRLVDGAIRGMMLQLDPYSGYISAEELPAFERRSRGDFSGVGVEIGSRDGQLMVIAPVEGSPAARAGVRAGDVILSLDGEDLEGHSVFDVEEMLVGGAGTRVALQVRHSGESDPTELTVTRGPVHLKTVRGYRRDPQTGQWDYLIDRTAGIGYIRVSNFRENTMADFDAALRETLDGGAKALLLDLRFNPGGLMQQGVAMADRFLHSGVIVSTVTRLRAIEEYAAVAEGTIQNVKLIVLINGGSASSAEIVAGALQARGRAVLVGERSFGKGSVQHLIHLRGHQAAIKLTVAYYRLPDGRIIHRTGANAHSDSWGVKPDLEIVLSESENQAIRSSRQAIDSTSLPENPTNEQGSTSPANSPTELLLDRQLAAALEMARGTQSPAELSGP